MKNTRSLIFTAALAAAAPAAKRAPTFDFLGVNEAGPEFGESKLPGVYNTDYTWPTFSTIDTFIDAGMNTFRINTLMERMVPDDMTGAFDDNYMGNLTETVNYITDKGAYAMINPHNYGRYYGEVFTSASDFKTFWQNVAEVYRGNDLVIFDTNNEFNTEAGQNVADMNQAAIDGIRAAGATSQWITVEGNSWTGAWTWTTSTGTDGKTNAETMGDLTDSEDKIIYQMHQYLDSDGSGTSEECVSSTIGAERLEAATEWLRDNGKIGLIGEFAGGVNEQCETAIEGMLEFMSENTDVWKGAVWWSAGPWWADYMYSLEPESGPAYSTYTPILEQYA